MKICLRFHMSKIFDSGWAAKLLKFFKDYGEVVAVVSGTMGAVAMMDSGLNINILKERFVDWANRREFDLVISATQTISVNRMLADGWHLSRRLRFPVIGIETSTMTLAYWGNVEEIAKEFAAKLGFKLVEGPDFGITFWRDGKVEYRRILAVEPGDWILVNGIIVGRAVKEDVIFVCESGRILEVKGAEVNWHGVQKLGYIDLEKAKIDTIKVLRDEVKNRARLSYSAGRKIAFIDHAGYEVFKFLEEGICCAVTIGDDTTAIVGDILERFGVPVIGVVDGDLNGLLPTAKLHPNSVILKVKNDDAFGRRIYRKVFQERDVIEGDLESIKHEILKLLAEEG
ncbi:MAG: DUF2117 domain-containing protein [Candidatus Nezhaarchaeales archaeon]